MLILTLTSELPKPDGNVITLVAPVKVAKAAPTAVSLTAKKPMPLQLLLKLKLSAGTVCNLAAKNAKLWLKLKINMLLIALADHATFYVYMSSLGSIKLNSTPTFTFRSWNNLQSNRYLSVTKQSQLK